MGFYNFEEFCEAVTREIREYLGGEAEWEVQVHPIMKNNGILLHALQILSEDRNCSPSIYLEPYYSSYEKGSSMDELLKEMAEFYWQHENDLQLEVKAITSFAGMKDKIIMRMVNLERNRELLAESPYVVWNDLAITFRWMAYQNDVGIATALITNRELQQWQVDVEVLMQTALENTPRYFPAYFQDIEELVKEIVPAQEWEQFQKEWNQEEQQLPMYVLTNSQRMNGAAVILYPGMLEQLSQQYPQGFYLLPSSIHEWILIPWEAEIEVTELQQMVANVNEEAVAQAEWLSENIYCYRTETEGIQVVFCQNY